MDIHHTQILTLKRTDSVATDFLELVKHLDIDLESRYGEQQKFFNQFNKLSLIKNVVIAYLDKMPVGCGAFKVYDVRTVEIKRMFVSAGHRGHGIASRILCELESWATELNYKSCLLETGKKQPEAIRLYNKCGYRDTENYDEYAGIEMSLCLRKQLE